MNRTRITTDGVCVYVHTKVGSNKFIRIIVRIALTFILAGSCLIGFSKTDSTISILGALFLLSGLLLIMPLLRTIMWNLYGEEIISFSTKSIVHQLGYGLFRLKPKTYTYDKRLKFHMEVLRDIGGVKEGILHFYSYNEDNQPFHLFRTTAYVSSIDCSLILEKIQLIFSLDKEVFGGYSAN